MTLSIKLCGVRSVQDALLCAAEGADEVGIILARASKRCVPLSLAQQIRAALPARVSLVGVFLDASADELAQATGVGVLSAVQLHGALPARLPDLPLYVALHVASAESLQRIREVPFAARVLLDSPKGGGSGAPFDWSLAARARALQPRSLFVAGGLTPDNVAEAIRRAQPDGVDVASGIEGPDGFKDPARVRAFVQAARRAAKEI